LRTLNTAFIFRFQSLFSKAPDPKTDLQHKAKDPERRFTQLRSASRHLACSGARPGTACGKMPHPVNCPIDIWSIDRIDWAEYLIASAET
jgi:hypothetical protein